MDGVIIEQQVKPGNRPGHSDLTVIGEDLTTVMDLIEFSGMPYPAMPPRRVASILAASTPCWRRPGGHPAAS